MNDEVLQELVNSVGDLKGAVNHLSDEIKNQVALMQKDVTNIKLQSDSDLALHEARENLRITRVETTVEDGSKDRDRLRCDIAQLYDLNRQNATETGKILREVDKQLEVWKQAFNDRFDMRKEQVDNSLLKLDHVFDERINAIENKPGKLSTKIITGVGAFVGMSFIGWLIYLISRALSVIGG